MQLDTQNQIWKNQWAPFWSGWIVFLIGFFWIVMSQIIAIGVLIFLTVPDAMHALSEDQIMMLALDGDAVGLGFLIALPMVLLTLSVVIKVRRNQSVMQYLGLRCVDIKVLMRWLAYLLIFAVLMALLEQLFDRPAVPEWMLIAFESADYVVLLFVAVSFLGPITEELLFRGYLLRVWSQSWLGNMGANVLVSLIWAAIHLQYDWFDMSVITVFGILLGASRLKTGSLMPAISMHICWNSFVMTYMMMAIS